jgi:hypothetical protein
MAPEKSRKLKDRFVWVTDREGNEYVCAIDALQNPDNLTEEEKSRCYSAKPPQETTGA